MNKSNTKKSQIVDSKGYQLFPVNLLPTPIIDFVNQAAEATPCPPILIVLPLLSSLGAAIGTSRILVPKQGWFVPSVFWTCIVGKSGSTKSPALNIVVDKIRDLESEAYKQFRCDEDRYQQSMKNKKKSEVSLLEKPIQKRYCVDDTTTEALLPVLEENPHGVMVINDELKSWFASFDRYVSGKGGDAAKWLSIWNGKAVSVDRKTADKKSVRVDAPVVNVTGTIQPAVLERSVGKEHTDNGLLARILLASPPSCQETWDDKEVSEECESKLKSLLRSLFKLEHSPALKLALSEEAKPIWAEFYNGNKSLVSETSQSCELASYAFSKHDQYCLRIALLIHVVEAVASGVPKENLISRETMSKAIDIMHWFQHEIFRTYQNLDFKGKQNQVMNLVSKIVKKGGKISVRELQNSNSKLYPNAKAAKHALFLLKEADFGDWSKTRENVYELIKLKK